MGFAFFHKHQMTYVQLVCTCDFEELETSLVYLVKFNLTIFIPSFYLSSILLLMTTQNFSYSEVQLSILHTYLCIHTRNQGMSKTSKTSH